MGIVNKRNAVVGWLVLKAGKRAAKKKAQSVGPATKRQGAALGGALAALGGALLFHRRKRKKSRDGDTA
jgi:LPXTG-motif cell wall-anchored protein